MKKMLVLAFTIICLSSAKGQINPETLEGQWFVRFNSKDIGTVHTLMSFEAETGTFHAYSRRNADRDILGWWASTLARTFTDNFKNGSLLRIEDGISQQEGDTLFLAAIFKSALGDYYFNGFRFRDTIHAKLRNGAKEKRGSIIAWRSDTELPLEDYPRIFEAELDTVRSHIYDAAIVETADWKKFEQDMRAASAEATDDIEMVFAHYYFAGKLPVSHFFLTKESDVSKEPTESNSSTNIELEKLNRSTALLKIKSFAGSASGMDSIMDAVTERNYKCLIVDLRGNPGGSIEAGMAFATAVADTAFYGGIFLTRKWFDENPAPPPVNEYAEFPYFTEANYDLLMDGIHTEKGLSLKVVPQPDAYEGELYILTDNRTASTCEPIVYGLKRRNRATVVGERTAGAMLNGEKFSLPDGFTVILPTAAYYTADGYMIDQHGVAPDIEVASEEALDYVLKNLVSAE